VPARFQPDAGINEAVRFLIDDALAMQQALVLPRLVVIGIKRIAGLVFGGPQDDRLRTGGELLYRRIGKRAEAISQDISRRKRVSTSSRLAANSTAFAVLRNFWYGSPLCAGEFCRTLAIPLRSPAWQSLPVAGLPPAPSPVPPLVRHRHFFGVNAPHKRSKTVCGRHDTDMAVTGEPR
jgi:hypothetical protein